MTIPAPRRPPHQIFTTLDRRFGIRCERDRCQYNCRKKTGAYRFPLSQSTQRTCVRLPLSNRPDLSKTPRMKFFDREQATFLRNQNHLSAFLWGTLACRNGSPKEANRALIWNTFPWIIYSDQNAARPQSYNHLGLPRKRMSQASRRHDQAILHPPAKSQGQLTFAARH